MTIAGIILLLIIIYRLITCYDYEKNLFFFFMMTVIVNVFINIGYLTSLMPSLSYGEFLMIFCTIYGFYGKKRISLKQIGSVLLLLICVFIGNYNIFLNSSKAMVVSWNNTNIDYVLYGFESASHPVFGNSNITSMLWLVIFIVFCLEHAHFFKDEYYVKKMTNILLKTFHVFGWLIILEFVISNLTSGVFARNAINVVFGVAEEAKKTTYMIAPKRYGFYCAYGLFVEPSYMAIYLIYGGIITTKKNLDTKEIRYAILSMICLIATGSTAAYMLLPFLLGIVVYKNCLMKVNKRQRVVLEVGCVLLGIAVIYIGLSTYKISASRDSVLDKIVVYLFGNDSSINSGYTRSNGNALCYGVLKYNPLFGVGLGTTRGYGFIPGGVACLGGVGLLALFNFYIKIMNIEVKKYWFVLLIIIAYLTSYFSIWHIYSPFIIGMFLAFNKLNVVIDDENIESEDCMKKIKVQDKR